MPTEKERDSVISNLRACLISAPGGIAVNLLNADYQQIIGENVPFKKLGYITLEDFLRSIPGLVVKLRNGIPHLEAEKSESTAHISNLVQNQKRPSARRRKGGFRSFPPRRHNIQQKKLQPLIDFSINKKQYTPLKISVSSEASGYDKPVRKINMTTSPVQSKPFQRSPPLSNTSFPPRQQRLSKITSTPEKAPSSPPYIREVREVPYNGNNQNILRSFETDSHGYPEFNKQQPIKREEEMVKNPFLSRNAPSRENQFPTPAAITPKNSLSDRLTKGAVPTSGNDINQKAIDPPHLLAKSSYSPPSQETSKKKDKPIKQSAQNRLEHKRHSSKLHPVTVDLQHGEEHLQYQQQLKQFAQNKNWKEPEYVVFRQKHKSGTQYLCRITPAEPVSFDTFNHDYYDAVAAKEEVAKVALDALLKREKYQYLPVAMNPTFIIKRVEEMVKEKGHGMWAQNIEDEYKIVHSEVLPEYWMDVILKSDHLQIEELANSSYIIKIKESFSSLYSLKINMPILILPEENTWDVFVTRARAVDDLWIRLIGDNYSGLMDNLMAEMEAFYENKHMTRTIIEVGEYYAAFSDEHWARVLVTDIVNEHEVKVKFIDHGDIDFMDMSDLLTLEPNFKSLAPQAIRVCLAGLEDYIDRNDAYDFLLNTVGISLVAIVESRKPFISLTLFDTSNEDAVNMNEMLKRFFSFDYVSTLSIEEGGAETVYVTHIESTGKVFIQIVSEHLTLLAQQLELLDDGTVEGYGIGDPSELDFSKLYLLKKDYFYRVQVQQIGCMDGRIKVFYCDRGCTEYVFMEDLFDLENISIFLSQMPCQAICVALHDIPQSLFTPKRLKKLRELVFGDPQPTIAAKFRDLSDITLPVIELFKRSEPHNYIISINQTVLLEDELEFDELTKKLQDLNLKPANKMTKIIRGEKRMNDYIFKAVNNFPPHSIEHKIAENRPAMPEIGEDFEIYIQDTANPVHFMVQPADHIDPLNELLLSMTEFYNNSKHSPLELFVGNFCAVRHNGCWKRAYVHNVIDAENATVMLLDSGSIYFTNVDNIQPLLKEYNTFLPYLGFSGRIHGIEPINGDWTVEDCLKMKSLINGKKCKATLKGIIIDKKSIGGLTLDLNVVDTSGIRPINIGDNFIAEGRARAK